MKRILYLIVVVSLFIAPAYGAPGPAGPGTKTVPAVSKNPQLAGSPTLWSITPQQGKPAGQMRLVARDVPKNPGQSQVWFQVGKDAAGKEQSTQGKIINISVSGADIVYEVQIPRVHGVYVDTPGNVHIRMTDGTRTNGQGFDYLAYPACVTTQANPSAAQVNDTVKVSGINLNAACRFFVNAGGQQVEIYPQQNTLTAQLATFRIPSVKAGKGTIEAMPRTAAQAAANQAPFEVQPSVPILQQVDPQAAFPGQDVMLNGEYRPGEPFSGLFTLSNGEKFEAPGSLETSGNQVRVRVPDIFRNKAGQLYGADELQRRMKLTATVAVKRGAQTSKAVPMLIRNPYPALIYYSKSTANPGEAVLATIANLDMDLGKMTPFFEYLPGKAAPGQITTTMGSSKTVIPGSAWVIVPDVFAGRPQAEQDQIAKYDGKIWLRTSQGKDGTPLVFLIRPKPKASVNNEVIALRHPLSSSPHNEKSYGMNYYEGAGHSPNKIARVTNTSKYLFRLWRATNGGKGAIQVDLGPGASTTAFNGLAVSGIWGAAGPVASNDITGTMRIDW